MSLNGQRTMLLDHFLALKFLKLKDIHQMELFTFFQDKQSFFAMSVHAIKIEDFNRF